MSSFFTIPGSQKKRKRPAAPEAPKKRISGSKQSSVKSSARTGATNSKRGTGKEPISDDDSADDESYSSTSNAGEDEDKEDLQSSDDEGETAAEKRLRLAERYLENIKEHVDDAGFDAADIDRDLIAERLQEDVAETKGRVYRQLSSQLAFQRASQTFFRTNTNSVTSIATCAPFVYTTTKDIVLHKWRTQDLPQYQFPQTTKRKPTKPTAPPRKRPQLVAWIKGNKSKSKDKNYKRHTAQILAVAASPDGKYVVTGGEDNKLIVYEADTLKPIKVLTHHRDAITGLAFRRGTNQLYSSSRDRTVKVWSLDELAYIETLFGHQDHVVDIDALALERCVSVGARDRTARLWKVMEETQLVFRGGAVDKKNVPQDIDPRSLLHEGSMDRIAMIDDDLFVTGSDNGAIALWSVTKKKPVYIQSLAHGLDPAIDAVDASAEVNPDPKRVVPAPTPRWITALKTVPYSDLILSGSWDGHVRVWRLTEDKRKIEQIGVLGDFADDYDNESVKAAPNLHGTAESRRPIPGLINDIAVFERGERGKDGLCVVAAVAQEHRFGRWKVLKGGVRNGGVVFEISRVPASQTNGDHESSPSDDDESDS
ncbi:WD domain, G-beta repeat containing protein [Metarhizium album ARSEF 1941]|uniref:WD domain, G-beta repeat containing protein n=1 Tax=Metarhizium album (strain ARSEF 1941) TaxID=1081103 RepID=A0A0B2WYX2_METAS|nr:WD domain, G-beta repeat containing protein [Metarhizium album ARSEF 1941]KHO01492.1 WD domain, G-beta repeat containing protein [Metarhizium album ARSEF 1941]